MSGKSLIFGQDARDASGRIDVGRSLADMLPPDPPPDPAGAQISAVPVVRSAQIRRAQIAALTCIGLAVLIGLVALTRPGAAPAAAQPTVLPTAQPAAAALAATATPRSCVITQTTPAFYAPAGAPAPLAIERGTACQVVAWHAGLPDWRQITIGGGAPVWVPLAVVSMASTAGLVDLAPPPTATPAPATQTPIVIVREVVVAPAPCTEQNASFRSRRDPRGNEPLVGYAVAWSCESQADADSKAEASFQDIMRGMP